MQSHHARTQRRPESDDKVDEDGGGSESKEAASTEEQEKEEAEKTGADCEPPGEEGGEAEKPESKEHPKEKSSADKEKDKAALKGDPVGVVAVKLEPGKSEMSKRKGRGALVSGSADSASLTELLQAFLQEAEMANKDRMKSFAAMCRRQDQSLQQLASPPYSAVLLSRSAILSAAGMVLLRLGVLQSSTETDIDEHKQQWKQAMQASSADP